MHQADIDTRNGNYVDILIDSIGIFFGILLFEKQKTPKKGVDII